MSEIPRVEKKVPTGQPQEKVEVGLEGKGDVPSHIQTLIDEVKEIDLEIQCLNKKIEEEGPTRDPLWVRDRKLDIQALTTRKNELQKTIEILGNIENTPPSIYSPEEQMVINNAYNTNYESIRKRYCSEGGDWVFYGRKLNSVKLSTQMLGFEARRYLQQMVDVTQKRIDFTPTTAGFKSERELKEMSEKLQNYWEEVKKHNFSLLYVWRLVELLKSYHGGFKEDFSKRFEGGGSAKIETAENNIKAKAEEYKNKMEKSNQKKE